MSTTLDRAVALSCAAPPNLPRRICASAACRPRPFSPGDWRARELLPPPAGTRRRAGRRRCSRSSRGWSTRAPTSRGSRSTRPTPEPAQPSPPRRERPAELPWGTRGETPRSSESLVVWQVPYRGRDPLRAADGHRGAGHARGGQHHGRLGAPLASLSAPSLLPTGVAASASPRAAPHLARQVRLSVNLSAQTIEQA
jgi:hypothetical protein